MGGAAAPSRREARRKETVDEIKTRARAHLAEHGPGGLSLRAVAREMGMSSAAIYRYFDNQSALIGALCIDAYTALGDSIDAARTDADPHDLQAQWWAMGHAIRQWTLAHPHDFALIFGTPIAGFHADAAVTGPAASRALLSPMVVYLAAVENGSADLTRCQIPELLEPGDLGAYLLDLQETALAKDIDRQHLLRIAAVGLNAWASILGFLVSEQFGNLPRLVSSVDALYDSHLRTVLCGMGFTESEQHD
ncbi:TetR/AcrR family transcriptional regulator [Rhodococcoides fascians]|uniref:TetR/AcrR family transcriptional regulator n=1 Tax=Rhodococcoides fascians TaxID=1828 RepID=UPI00068ADDDF|nr:TetR/AcrR family transcriptional regulator [Rhodococcus fascians]